MGRALLIFSICLMVFFAQTLFAQQNTNVLLKQNVELLFSQYMSTHARGLCDEHQGECRALLRDRLESYFEACVFENSLKIENDQLTEELCRQYQIQKLLEITE